MNPGTYNFSVVRGSSAEAKEFSPLIVRIQVDGAALAFEKAILSGYSIFDDDRRGHLLFRADTTEIGPGRLVVTDEYAAEVTWMPSVVQTRKLHLGPSNYYELEVRVSASEVVLLRGVIEALGGLNDDESVS